VRARSQQDWSMEGGDETSGSRAGQKTAPWTRTEDQVISEAVKRFGCKWGVLSALLPGRTDNAVRNRWHRLERARKWREEVASRRQGGSLSALDAEELAPPPPPSLALSAGPRTSGSGGYKCGRCGQPKRGHLCTVTLEADQVVYEAAQDKMRQLHLQQVRARPQPLLARAACQMRWAVCLARVRASTDRTRAAAAGGSLCCNCLPCSLFAP
jgi:hypothetical protein